MSQIARPTTGDDCSVCNGLLGPMDTGDGKTHYFCAWATPDDWKALRPFLTGTFDGVQAGGA